MINFILGFSICLNILLILVLVYFLKLSNQENDNLISKKINRKDNLIYGKEFNKRENTENIDYDFFGNDF